MINDHGQHSPILQLVSCPDLLAEWRVWRHFIVHPNSLEGNFIFSKNTFEMRYIELANIKFFFSTDTGEILAKIKDTYMLKLCAEKIHSTSTPRKGNFNEMWPVVCNGQCGQCWTHILCVSSVCSVCNDNVGPTYCALQQCAVCALCAVCAVCAVWDPHCVQCGWPAGSSSSVWGLHWLWWGRAECTGYDAVQLSAIECSPHV